MTEPTSAKSLALDLTINDAKLEAELAAASARAVKENWADRAIGRRDPSVWSDEDVVQRAIATRLGWLEAPFHFADETDQLKAFAAGTHDDGFKTAVLGGMGGSSLAPALLAHVFGVAEGGTPVRVLDSTDPAAVAATLDDLNPTETLFIVSTKSGTTAESLSFQAYEWDRIAKVQEAAGVWPTEPGNFMAAITDPDKSLRSIPHHDALRETFINPPDVGGRYSALTYVGLVPSALLGVDIDLLLEKARAMVVASGVADPAANPGLALGIAMGVFAANGRDKLTFVIDGELAAFGPWVEQLIAESTGKETLASVANRAKNAAAPAQRVGVVPVDGEPLGPVSVYGNDRVFVRITLKGSAGPDASVGSNVDARLAELAAAGHPVIRIAVDSKIELGAEFVRWEIATALASIVLGIDPFDQPNVEEAKTNTRAVLAAIEAGDKAQRRRLVRNRHRRRGGPEGGAQGPPRQARPERLRLDPGLRGPDPGPRRLLSGHPDVCCATRPTGRRPSATGRGSSTPPGQLHKGGAPSGWFLQLVAEHPDDREIPGKAYTFGSLIDAQAIGDAQTIESHKLPILRINLGPDPDAGLAALGRALAAALKEA
jgi:transaldolase/glucose-6-phosphate isomerase